MEATSKPRQFLQRPKSKGRPRSAQKRHPTRSTAQPAGNGFLNHRFMPLVNGYPPEIRCANKLEKEFFKSMQYFCNLYELPFKDFSEFAYPQNIDLATVYLKESLLEKQKDLQVLIVGDSKHRACICASKTFDTKTTLYFLPLEPLYRLWKYGDKSSGELLLSVVAYLYQVANVSCHVNEDSHLYYTYEMLVDWLQEEDEDKDLQEVEYKLDQFNLMQEAGQTLLLELSKVEHLRYFEQRVIDFRPIGALEIALLKMATDALFIYKRYNDRTIYDRIHSELLLGDDDDSGHIRVEQYISFMWSFEDCFYDELMECVNAELNEYSTVDEPSTLQFFDCMPEKETHDHIFEEKFFQLLNDLTDTLIDFSHEKYNQTV